MSDARPGEAIPIPSVPNLRDLGGWPTRDGRTVRHGLAFRSTEPVYGSNPTQQQLRLAALDRAGVAVWEWSARHDEIKLDPVVEATLGLGQGELPTKCDEFSQHLHPADRDRFQTAVAAVALGAAAGAVLAAAASSTSERTVSTEMVIASVATLSTSGWVPTIAV